MIPILIEERTIPRSYVPYPTLAAAALFIAACTSGVHPQQIVDRAIRAHGGPLADVVIEFDFREYHYSIARSDGYFRYTRSRPDSAGLLRDVLDNDGFYREIDGRRVDLPAGRDSAYASSVNAVAYFMLLPFKLNDAAVRKRYMGEVVIAEEPYHEIEVTFAPEGGGRDYQDRFVYWFHRDRYTMDYLAYDYVSDEGGTRFREAVNPRTIGGLRFADYRNYTSDVIDRPGEPIEHLDRMFVADSLELVSTIVMKDITVRPFDDPE